MDRKISTCKIQETICKFLFFCQWHHVTENPKSRLKILEKKEEMLLHYRVKFYIKKVGIFIYLYIKS